MIRKELSSGRRFRFHKESVLALANAVLLAEDHTASKGEMKEKISVAFQMLCASKFVIHELSIEMPTIKISKIQEQYRKLLENE